MSEKIRRHLSDYLAEHPDEKERLAQFSEQIDSDEQAGADITSRSNMTGHVTASMVILNHDHTEALLIAHKHHKLWLSPGGHVEAGEDLSEAALREAEEETGIEGIKLLQGTAIDIDSHPITARPAKKETEHFHHDFLFLGCAPQNAVISHQEKEVSEARWFAISTLAKTAVHMDRVTSKLNAFLARKA